MKNRITEKFDELKQRGEKALITYITAGDPEIETTYNILQCIADNGADILEIGTPFSDPIADGPTIQRAFQRALKNGISLHDIFSIIERFRAKYSQPVVLFGYYNPFLRYGYDNLCRDAKRAGVDGFLVVDMPPEESADFKKHAYAAGLETICLLAPTSTDKRIQTVSETASGFLYYVAVTGVTGARTSLDTMLGKNIEKIKKHTKLPVCAGFGISSPEQVRSICHYADGVIVGSAIINIIENNQNNADILDKVGRFVCSLKDATKQAT